MINLDKYFKNVGILAHFLVFIYLAMNHESYVYGFVALILGIFGYVYINFKIKYISFSNFFRNLYVGSGVLLCSLLISFPLAILFNKIFELSNKFNSLVLIGSVMILLSISIAFNFWYHKHK